MEVVENLLLAYGTFLVDMELLGAKVTLKFVLKDDAYVNIIDTFYVLDIAFGN